jgi:hypothetical protein
LEDFGLNVEALASNGGFWLDRELRNGKQMAT